MICDHKLILGAKTRYIGELCFKAHSEYTLLTSIRNHQGSR